MGFCTGCQGDTYGIRMQYRINLCICEMQVASIGTSLKQSPVAGTPPQCTAGIHSGNQCLGWRTDCTGPPCNTWTSAAGKQQLQVALLPGTTPSGHVKLAPNSVASASAETAEVVTLQTGLAAQGTASQGQNRTGMYHVSQRTQGAL